MDTLLKAPLYIIATNPYIVPNLPLLFGKFPGDEYYSLMKYVFFFLFIAIITYAIFSSHNGQLADDSSKSEEMKNIAKEGKTTLADTVIIMFVVMFIYFLISVFFFPVQLIKVQYEAAFNSIFFVVAFGLISFIYTLITDNMLDAKKASDLKTNVFGIGLTILLILYVLFDGQISGSVPGLDLIPPQIRKLMNLSIKIDAIRSGGDTMFINELKDKLTSSGRVTASEVDKLIRISAVALDSMPPIARSFIDRFKNQTNTIDKLLGPVDIDNVSQMADFIGNPLVKIMLSLTQV
jgi:hypothetical protein